MAKKRILITGTAGFIASHVAQKLLERGDEVLGIDQVNDYYDLKQKKENMKLLEKTSFYKENNAQ